MYAKAPSVIFPVRGRLTNVGEFSDVGIVLNVLAVPILQLLLLSIVIVSKVVLVALVVAVIRVIVGAVVGVLVGFGGAGFLLLVRVFSTRSQRPGRRAHRIPNVQKLGRGRTADVLLLEIVRVVTFLGGVS